MNKKIVDEDKKKEESKFSTFVTKIVDWVMIFVTAYLIFHIYS